MALKLLIGFTEFQCALFIALNGLLIILFELPIVIYCTKKDINKLKVTAFGISFMSAGYLILLTNLGIFSLILMIIFITFGAMLTFPFINDFVRHRTHKNLEGKFMALSTLSYSVAHVITSKTGMEIIYYFNYKINWIFLSLLGISGTIITFLLYRMDKKETEIKEKK